ncbi:MAG: hypothetical protein JNM84_24765, partial [Planctomycetes bacterium]|nr:hypothetical protein [Planctomycetota bacterium]
LVRPQDAAFFGRNLRAIVLDEAHLYGGALAGEIAYLLRRLCERCGVSSEDLLGLASTATLGGDEADARGFLAELLSRDVQRVSFVRGVRSQPPMKVGVDEPIDTDDAALERSARLAARTLDADPDGTPRLRVDADECARLAAELRAFSSSAERIDEALRNSGGQPARLLYRALPGIAWFDRVLRAVAAAAPRSLPLGRLSSAVIGRDGARERRAVSAWLRLGSQARESLELHPLLPTRVHALVRSGERLGLCLDPRCTGEPARIIAGFGAVCVLEADTCPSCGGAVLELLRCEDCGEALLAGRRSTEELPLAPDAGGTRTSERLVPARWRPGQSATFFALESATPGSEAEWLHVGSPEATAWPGELVETGSGRELPLIDTGCPRCGATADHFKALGERGGALDLQVIAETLLGESPPLPCTDGEPRPGGGRRLLAFSDSRRGAALLGPSLSYGHEYQLIRGAILACLPTSGVTAEDLGAVQEEQEIVERELRRSDLSPARRRLLESRLRFALVELERSTGAVSWSELAQRLGVHPALRELCDLELGANVRSAEESAATWDRNDAVARAVERLNAYLARELGAWDPHRESLASAGLVEVRYPGLEAVPFPRQRFLELPDRLIARLEMQWLPLLAFALDDLRRSRALHLDPRYQLDARLLEDHPFFGSARTRREFVGARSTQRMRTFAAEVLVCGVEESGATRLADVDHAAKSLLEALFDALYASSRAGGLCVARAEERGAEPALRVELSALAFARPQQLWRCSLSGLLFPRSVERSAPVGPCLRTLVPHEHDGVHDDGSRFRRLRREIGSGEARDLFEMGLWASEHTAQLSPTEARRIQELFKAGYRNLLSSSTTLELGIDIGGLCAVLCANLPPGPASYLQRAGRAGRRADGSSMIVAFAKPQPFDREVFRDFGGFLDRPLRRPMVILHRQRIARRHLHAWLLGSFFRELGLQAESTGTMSAFGWISSFCGLAAPEAPEAGIAFSADRFSTPPSMGKLGAPDAESYRDDFDFAGAALRVELEELDGALAESIGVFVARRTLAGAFDQHLRRLSSNPDRAIVMALDRLFGEALGCSSPQQAGAELERARDTFRATLRPWLRSWAREISAWFSLQQDQVRALHARRTQMLTLLSRTTIEILADLGFLPRYGFPIGLLRLRVLHLEEGGTKRDSFRRPHEEERMRLERAGLLAMAEYVPGTKLVVAGREIVSRGLQRQAVGQGVESFGERWFLSRCENDHLEPWSDDAAAACSICAAPRSSRPQQVLLPLLGFSTAAWDEPRWSRGEVERVGRVERLALRLAESEAHPPRLDFAEVLGLQARLYEGGELFVYNAGNTADRDPRAPGAGLGLGFAICTRCGYAEPELSPPGDGVLDLPPGFREHAPLTSARRDRRCEGEQGSTILRRQVLAARQRTDLVLLVPDATNGPEDEAAMHTTAQALALAGARLLHLDERELGGMATPFTGGPAILIYDTTP